MSHEKIYPKISIITPSYNQGEFIERTILSILEQNYPNLEYIIIDGGSTDNTVDIIKKYENKLTYWCSEKDRGQSHALNKGFAIATGEILTWLNSDDYYEDDILFFVAEQFKDSSVNIINGNCQIHYLDGTSWLDKSGKVTIDRLLSYWELFFCPPQPSIFYRKTAFDKVGGCVNESLHYGMDLDLWVRFSLVFEFKYVDKLFSHYIIHTNSKSGAGAGFLNFVPEWKKICRNYLKEIPFKNRMLFYEKFYLGRPYKVAKKEFASILTSLSKFKRRYLVMNKKLIKE